MIAGRIKYYSCLMLMVFCFNFFVLVFTVKAAPQKVLAQSCSFTDVHNALQRTQDGDTLLIPAGMCDWQANNLNVVKELTIIGAGIGAQGTTLIRSQLTSSPLITFNCLDKALAFEIKGIKFQGLFRDDIPSTPDRGILTSHGCQDFLITDNEFTGFAAAGIDITDHTNTNPRNRGVVANNRFIENFQVGLGYGVTVSSGGLNELEIPFGSESFVFIEDNYFAKNRHAVTSNLDAAYVFRYNHIEDNYPNFSAVDTHGDTTADERGGTKIVELYNNRIEQGEEIDFFHDTSGVNNPGFAGIGLRGGQAVIFDNVIANFRKPIVLLVESNEPCDDLTPPFIDRQPSGVYVGGNRLEDNKGQAVTGLSFGLSGECEHLFRLGTEYFFELPEAYTPYPYPHPLRGTDVNDNILDYLPAILSGVKNSINSIY